jgi:DNA modification methylase
MKMKETSLFDSLLEEPQKPSGPVTCLGMTFENDEARRAHFTEELRKKLQDPEFRKIEGFPIGSDEDILNLSDPPYYTACPNPWIADFIAEWEAQKPEQPEGYHYHREPFAADVSEGKNDPIYNAHSYHTKVPHKAIMRYILHYTQPGDIVFDGFCGTGMTGVAAQMCGDREVVMSLGYQVKPDGTILQEETDEDGKKVWRPFSKLGVRKAVLNDLSPAATFIAYNYNTPVDVAAFEKEARRILKEVEKEYGWMYETLHTDGNTKGKINYTVWSDVYVCPECASEVVYWDAAVDIGNQVVKSEFCCKSCNAEFVKRRLERAFVNFYDHSLNETIRQGKQVPVFINYTSGGKRYTKKFDEHDRVVKQKIDGLVINHCHPADRMMEGGETRRNDPAGITHTHHLYTKRNLVIISAILDKIKKTKLDGRLQRYLTVWFTSFQSRLHRMNRYAAQHGRHVGPMANTLYISATPAEISPFYFANLKIKENNLRSARSFNVQIGCGSAAGTSAESNSIDYLFVDPPFGSNIAYSELNFLWESWLKVGTNQDPEAIESKPQNKDLDDYRHLMTACFREFYRVLKPGRWMTVEFSNTNSSVWNSIQNALSDVGFIVAGVAALNKGRGGLHAIIGPTAVKQDLIISAYKPNGGFEERFQKEAQTEESVWDFVRTHLKYLPVTKQQGALLQFVPERDPRILFDQMVAYYVRKGYPVPISSQEFQIGLSQRFIERDGMYFLPDQVAEYDRKKMTSGELKQMAMFVSDEASAIQWLRQLIKEKPQTFSDINPQFMQQLGGWSKNEAQLDLRELLNQNFLCYDGKGPVPEQIHAYLSTNWKELRNLPKDDPTLIAKARDRWYVPDPNKAGDLEKLREKALLKEFEEYKEVKKKLKVFRLEAVRAGFKKAWQERDYAVIVAVADKIPNNVLEEDPKLLMWYDQAVTRMGGE